LIIYLALLIALVSGLASLLNYTFYTAKLDRDFDFNCSTGRMHTHKMQEPAEHHQRDAVTGCEIKRGLLEVFYFLAA